MANALMVIGGLFVLYLIALGIEKHFENKKVAVLQDSDDD